MVKVIENLIAHHRNSTGDLVIGKWKGFLYSITDDPTLSVIQLTKLQMSEGLSKLNMSQYIRPGRRSESINSRKEFLA